MATTEKFLRTQVEAYSESWKKDHEDAMACWELEGRIEIGLTLWRLIRKFDEEVSQGVQRGAQQFSAKLLRAMYEFYQAWYKPCPGVLKAIDKLENKKYKITNADAFRKAAAWTRLTLRVSPDELIEGAKQREQGEGRFLDEILDELSATSTSSRRKATGKAPDRAA